MSTDSPKVTIAIVCWNSAAYLPHCLDSLSKQTFSDFEVVLVDNGSTDGGVDGIAEEFPELQLRIEKLMSNRGFAVANNIAARLARGEWLALLNSDAFPEPDWLQRLWDATKEFPDTYFFTSRQIQANNPSRLDGEGDVYHVSGLAWRHNYNLPVDPAQGYQPVFSACGAAAMYPRQYFLDAGGFDEDYFAYFEDVDMGFRLQLMGLKCMFVPTAVVHHVGSASTGRTSDFVLYHGHRNLVWTFMKDMPGALFWFYLPLHILMNLYYLASFTLAGLGRPLWRAKIDALRGLPSSLQKRRIVQRSRSVPIGQIRKSMSHGLLVLFRMRSERNRAGQ